MPTARNVPPDTLAAETKAEDERPKTDAEVQAALAYVGPLLEARARITDAHRALLRKRLATRKPPQEVADAVRRWIDADANAEGLMEWWRTGDVPPADAAQVWEAAAELLRKHSPQVADVVQAAPDDPRRALGEWLPLLFSTGSRRMWVRQTNAIDDGFGTFTPLHPPPFADTWAGAVCAEKPPEWFRLLCRARLEAKLADEKAFHALRPLAVPQVADAEGRRYAVVPKVVAGWNWAHGGTGRVEVDGTEYAAVGPAAKVVPHGYVVLPRDAEHVEVQQLLPLSLEPLRPGFILLATAGAHPQLLNLHAAKLSLLACMAAGPQRATVGELARLIKPGQKRFQQRDYVQVAEALNQMEALYAYMPCSGEPRIRVFDVVSFGRPQDVLPVAGTRLGLADGMREWLDALPKGDPYNGGFLLNWTGAMELTEERLLRHFVQGCAAINASFDRAANELSRHNAPTWSIDQWCLTTNVVPPQVAEYWKAKGVRLPDWRRKDASKARTAAWNELGALQDLGLLKIEGPRDAFRVLPTEGHKEAWRQARNDGRRPKRLKPPK